MTTITKRAKLAARRRGATNGISQWRPIGFYRKRPRLMLFTGVIGKVESTRHLTTIMRQGPVDAGTNHLLIFDDLQRME